MMRPAAMAALLALLVGAACGGAPPPGGAADAPGPPPPETAAAAPAAEPPVVEANRITVTLYFLSGGGGLVAERRDLPIEEQRHEQARLVMEALLAGPRGGALRVIPPDATLRAVYLQPDGTAYVDLDAAFGRGLARGSEDALTAVRSIVDTLAVNFPEVRRVKILVDGRETLALGGHLDLSRPIAPDAFVARAAP